VEEMAGAWAGARAWRLRVVVAVGPGDWGGGGWNLGQVQCIRGSLEWRPGFLHERDVTCSILINGGQ
jgi:hypothetical protein